MNSPKLRFKEFTDSYKKMKYKDVLKIKSGKDQKRIECKNGKYPILGTGGKIGTTNMFLYNKPSVLIGRKGTINKPQYMETPFWTVDTLFYSQIYKPNIPKYLFYSFQNVNWQKYDESTGVPSLSSSTIESVECFIPSIDEQIKVSNFLSLLDKKIELQTKKIEALKLFKSYTKSEIFKNGNHVCKLGAILNKWNKKNKDGAINYVESISNKAGFIPQSEQFEDRNVASKNLRNYYVIKKGVFGYNPSRLNVGSLALKENDFISVVSPLYECFTTTQNNTYLFEWFNSNNFKKETFSKFEGGVRNTLNFNNLCDIPINLPDIETQNQYAKYFNKINFKISLEEQKLSELVKFKKGLLQEMFI